MSKSTIVGENVKLHPSALVCVKSTTLTGDITIGENSIVNPLVRLLAHDGCQIVIGSRVLVEDRVTIENSNADRPLTIGDGVMIEADAVVRASVGKGAIVEMKAVIESDVPAGCVIGVKTVYRATNKEKAFIPVDQSQAMPLPSALPSTTGQLDLTRKHVRAYQEVYSPFPHPS